MKTITHKVSEPVDKLAKRLDQKSLYAVLKARLGRLSKNDNRLTIAKSIIIFFHYGDDLIDHIKNHYNITPFEERLLRKFLDDELVMLVKIVDPQKDVALS